jgi:RNA polymerase sigma-70 factor, ECF subfamily
MLPRTQSPAPPEVSVEKLYADHQHAILAHLMRLVSDREAAEDLCQETFLKAMRFWHQRKEEASPSAWLYRIATNTAYDYLRRRRRIQFSSIYEGEPLACDGPAMEMLLDEAEPVRVALLQLPSIYRVPLVMHSCDGHSTQEIADALGCTNSAVKTRLFRARERFRQLYQG